MEFETKLANFRKQLDEIIEFEKMDDFVRNLISLFNLSSEDDLKNKIVEELKRPELVPHLVYALVDYGLKYYEKGPELEKTLEKCLREIGKSEKGKRKIQEEYKKYFSKYESKKYPYGIEFLKMEKLIKITGIEPRTPEKIALEKYKIEEIERAAKAAEEYYKKVFGSKIAGPKGVLSFSTKYWYDPDY